MKNLKKKISGFTIIEVMIVLAVAGVIMLIVLLTVPGLQRNSRNTQRRSDATHMVSLINEFATNNNGSLPASVCFSGCSGATTLDLSKEHFSLLTWGGTTNTTFSLGAFASAPTLSTSNDQAYVYSGATCNGNTITAGGGARSFVVYYGAETSSGASAPQCVGS